MVDKAWLESLEKKKKFRRSYDYRDVKKEQVRILKFDYEEAFEIGTVARNLAKEEYPGKPVVVDISLRNGHSLFRIITNTGSLPDDDKWIKRNREMAIRFGRSSFFMKYNFKEKEAEDEKYWYYYLDSKEYKFFDGGALPIFIDSCEFPVACLTVIGLETHQNHWLAVESIREYIINVNNLAGIYTGTNEHAVDCAICLSQVYTKRKSSATYRIIPCKHVFHDQCLRDWVFIDGDSYYSKLLPLQCPVCRPSFPQGSCRRLEYYEKEKY